MRAYIVTSYNAIKTDDYIKLCNLSSKDEAINRLDTITVKAAFLSLEEAMNAMGEMLAEMEGDFDQNKHFQEDETARISVSIDIVEMSDSEFNEINEQRRVGNFFISATPLYEMVV